MAKQLKKPDQCLHRRRRNGYSIAEILLVFGIIAGVLVGMWAMYTLLADDADVKAAIADIRLIQHAAVQYKQDLIQRTTIGILDSSTMVALLLI